MVAERADQPAAQAGDSQSSRPARSARQLPADTTTDQAVELPGRTLRFKATAGSIPLSDGDGALQAEVAYVAYAMGGDTQRPVTFVFNGGPGAAPAFLRLGAIRPWRVPLPPLSVSTPPPPAANAGTSRGFTHRVFIYPPPPRQHPVSAGG